MKKEHVMMLLSCSSWRHDVSSSPSVDMVLHLAPTSPPLSVPVCTNVVVVCVFITSVPIIKEFSWGEVDMGGHVLLGTTIRGLCGLVCPSRTSERGGEGDRVIEE
jgi:hypothetical protein